MSSSEMVWGSRNRMRCCLSYAAMLALATFVGLRISAGQLQLLTAPAAGIAPSKTANGDSGAAIMSPDGRFILFASSANNLITLSNGAIPELFPGRLNVYLTDRSNNTTTLVSVNMTGIGGGDGDSWPAGLSSNGRYALFESMADNLVPGDTNGLADIFVRDFASSVTALTLVSTGTNGSVGNGNSKSATMTPDGRFVAFVSEASNLVSGDTNQIPDVFVRDLLTGTTALVSVGAVSPIPVPSRIGSESPDITPDGRYVAFFSSATNIVPGARSGGEIFLRDMALGTSTWVSAGASTGGLATAQALYCYNQVISADGSVVAYEASSNSTSAGVILRFNVQSGVTDIVNSNAVIANSAFEDVRTLDMTPDGRFIVFIANTNDSFSQATTCVCLWDAQSQSTIPVSVTLGNTIPSNAICDSPTIDPTGRWVTFRCNATNITANVIVGDFHTYVGDLQLGNTILIGADTNGVGYTVGQTTLSSVSSNGNVFTFDTPQPGLVEGDANRSFDVLSLDLATTSNQLISAASASLPSLSARGISTLSPGTVSTNGRLLVFSSEADNLWPGQTNGFRQIFVRDLVAGTNLLVSADTNGLPGNGISADPVISGDGRYVAFTSLANNLAAGDSNIYQDIFLRDIQAGSTSLVSLNSGGTASGNSSSYSPSISQDGRFVMFRSKASNLTSKFTSGENLFLRDTLLASTRALTTAGDGPAAMTPSGRYIAYFTSLGFGLPSYVFIFDTLAGTNVFTNSISSVTAIGISADGSHLVYSAGNQLNLQSPPSTSVTVVGPAAYAPHAGLRFSGDGRFMVYSGTSNSSHQVYLYDFQVGTNVNLSNLVLGAPVGSDSSDSPDISQDGRYVSFRTGFAGTAYGDSNGMPDIVLYDRTYAMAALVSTNRSGTGPGQNRSLLPVLSPDNSVLFFESWASDLTGQDLNHSADVFSVRLGAPTFTDSDGDGIDDQWELQYFGTLARDGSGDFDGDGMNDLNEFIAGTDPKDPNSAFRLHIIPASGPGRPPSLVWPAAPGRRYHLQYKNSIGETNWHDFQGSVVINGAKGYATESAPLVSQRFYRITVF